MAKTNPNFLNGVPELVLLRLLSCRPMYGYELVKAIHRESKSQLNFGEGCIYPVLHYLESAKLVRSAKQTVDGRSRHYYSLTVRGENRLKELTREWEGVIHGVELIFGVGHA